MTDSSSLVPNQQAVSSDCLFNLKPSSVPGRVYRASVPTSNKSSFSPQDTAILYIPGGRRNTFLDTTQTYIKYTINNSDASIVQNIDNNGACVINRLDSFSGSNLLETVQGYNILYSYMCDFQMDLGSKLGSSSNYGFGLGIADDTIRKGAALAVSSRLTVCMPLLSAVYGLGADKMLPIGLLGDDIRIEITFESQASGLVAASGTPTWTVTNMELELCIVELSDVGMSMVNSVTPFNQPIYLHGNSWRHYTSSLPASAGSFSTLVPARFASLKTLLLCPRCNTTINLATAYSTSSRANPNISQYWWRVGPYLIPNKPVTLISSQVGGFAEGYMEIIRSLHGLSHADVGNSIAFDQFNVIDGTAVATVGNGGLLQAGHTLTTSARNAFAIAQELELWSQRADVLISGMNTLASQVFFECNLDSAPTAVYTLDFYANFDIIFVLENGLLSARY